MLDLLSALTIGELFKKLAQVEQRIRACDPLFLSVGDHAALSPQLIDLAAEEQQICDELTRRRANLRGDLQSRLLATQSSKHARSGA